MRQGGVTMQEVAQQSVRATGTLVVHSAYNAISLMQQAAWSTGEAYVSGACQLWTWPVRRVGRTVFGAKLTGQMPRVEVGKQVTLR